MPRQHIAQDADLQPQARTGALDIADRPFQFGDIYPDVMLPADMQRAFRISRAKFFLVLRTGFFDRFEILPRIGHRTWSGALVAKYLRAGGREGYFFGRKRA